MRSFKPKKRCGLILKYTTFDNISTDLEDAHLKISQQTAHSHSESDRSKTTADFAEQFMQTLQEAERTKQVDSLVALFAENADLMNLAMQQPIQGKEAIRQFWQDYLSVFEQIQSRFTHTSEGNGTITLEWISEGALASGKPFSYRGVSVLETQGGQVRHFRTYYDSAAFLPEGAKHRD